MAHRDLTLAYNRLRSAFHRRAPMSENLGGGNLLHNDASGAVDPHMLGNISNVSPAYVEMVTEINGEVANIATMMEELKVMHQARLRVGFDQEAERQKEQDIEVKTAEITRKFMQCGNRLKRVADNSAEQEAERRMRQNMQRGIATRLHELSSEFRRVQKLYVADLNKMASKSSIESLIGGSGGAAGGGGGGEEEEEVDEGMSDAQMSAMANMQEDADERVREIQRIAKSVEDLAVLFRELNTLIVEQGTMLDRIDHNIEEAVEHSKKGVVELKQAEKYQKSARPIMCMGILMVLIIIMVIVIIVRKTN